MHKGAFLLMEGPNDIRRFEKFFEPKGISFIPCWGKSNVIETMDIVQNSGSEDCLGFVDADFDRVDSAAFADDDIIVSTNHDFDVDVCRTKVMDRYFGEVGDKTKVDAEGGCKECTNSLADALRPLSALRYANQKHSLGYRLSDIRLYEFFDGTVLDVDKMIDHVSTGKFSSAQHKKALKEFIARYSAIEVDIWQFTNGHDLTAAVGIALRQRIGTRQIVQTSVGEIERHFRLSFDHADFQDSGLRTAILTWQSRREGMSLLINVT